LSARLYGDLPDNEILATVPTWNAAQFIAHYNLALCQGLLLGAREMTVVVHDRDLGRRRRLLTALRFHRLLAEVRYAASDKSGEGDERPLQLTISGPDAVLDQASRYGINLALFLPVLCGLRHWEATADVRLPRREVGAGHATLELNDETGLASDRDLSAHIPDELRDLRDTLADKLPDRRCEDALPRTLPDGILVMPDLRLVGKTDAVDIELFHRWHAHALAKRLDHISAGLLPNLVIGVDRAVAKSPAGAALVATPAFVRCGFLFNDIPAPRAVLDAVKRVTASA
jgi:predicted nuclease of restriction endonuclease-like RecB superfamily